MGDKRVVYRFLMGKTEGRTLGKPSLIWEDNIKMVLQHSMGKRELDLCGLEYRRITGSCESSNGLPSSSF
jgi:hypothetical protein